MFKILIKVLFYIKNAVVNLISFFKLKTKVLATYIINNSVFVFFCKILFFALIIFLVTTSSVPFYEKISLFHSKVGQVYSILSSSSFLLFSNLTAPSGDTIILKMFSASLKKLENDFNILRESTSISINSILKSIRDLSITTSSLKDDVDTVTRSLDIAKEDILKQSKQISTLVGLLKKQAARVTDLKEILKTVKAPIPDVKEILKTVKAPIPGTFTAGQGMGSKVSSNRPK